MATEIERKFLVVDDAWREQADAGTEMVQGYLAAQEHCTVRVRLAGSAAKLTIKGASAGISRSEYEYDIPEADARAMLEDLCVGAPILKRRYRVPYAGHVWEVDVFEGANAGLVLAEVELDRADEALEQPSWAGEEVSDDHRYYNACLSRYPYASWPA
jgi:adenylate cyclase